MNDSPNNLTNSTPKKRHGLYRKTKARKNPNTGKVADHNRFAHNDHSAYVHEFVEWSRAVKKLSETTCQGRQYDLWRYVQWCDERGLSDPNGITKPILESYQKHLFYHRKNNGEPLGYSTQRRLTQAVKSLFKWLAQNNHILYNPASELEVPKKPHRLPKVILTETEINRVLNLPDTTTPYGVRDKAILETLYSTGIRRTELVNLQVTDVDLASQTLRVNAGKGNKDRILPLGEQATQWIKHYQQEVRPQLITQHNTSHLFLTDYGEPWIKSRLGELVKKYLYHANIDKPGACHLFRHAMATHMLNHGADIRFIQAMLGHAELSTTQIYTYVSIEKLREIHKKTHPSELDEELERELKSELNPTE